MDEKDVDTPEKENEGDNEEDNIDPEHGLGFTVCKSVISRIFETVIVDDIGDGKADEKAGNEEDSNFKPTRIGGHLKREEKKSMDSKSDDG